MSSARTLSCSSPRALMMMTGGWRPWCISPSTRHPSTKGRPISSKTTSACADRSAATAAAPSPTSVTEKPEEVSARAIAARRLRSSSTTRICRGHGLAAPPTAAMLSNAARHGEVTLSQRRLVLLQRFLLLRGLEHVTLHHLPVPRRRMEHRQLAPSPVQRVEEERQQHPDGTRDARVRVGRHHHDQEEQDAHETNNPEDGQPDRLPSIADLDVKRHPVGPRRVGVLEAQHEERSKHQQVSIGGAEGIHIRQDVNGGIAARFSGEDEGKNSDQESRTAKYHDRSCRRLVSRVHLVEPIGNQLKLAHRIRQA